MRPSIVSSSLLLFSSFITPSTSLEALSDSPCAVQCGNVLSSTSGSDIVCQNGQFASTTAGQTFQSCVTCQLGSNYVDPTTKETDLQWALYNIRYAISWCLFGFPNNTNVGDTPCITSTACGPLQNAFEFDSLSPNASAFGYCALMNSVSLPKCSACLSVQTYEFYLVNFVTALNGACQQQPTPGNLLSLQGSLFSTTPTNITSPSAQPTGPVSFATHGLTLSAKIGIAIAGLFLLLSVTGFCIVWHGKRRRRRILRERQRQSGYGEWSNHRGLGGNVPVATSIHSAEGTPPMKDVTGPSPGGFFDSPMSTRPLVQPWGSRFTEEETPISGPGEKAFFSPYSSIYGSPVSAADHIQVMNREWPMDRKGSVNKEWPVDRKGSNGHNDIRRELSRSRSKDDKDRKEKEGDRIELQNVAPLQNVAQAPVCVLKHPGHGRGASRALTEDDARRGAAM